MLESVLGVFGGPTNSYVCHVITNFVRRSFAAKEMYLLGRKHALDYTQGDRHVAISPYFLALTFFETCVSYTWQVLDILMSLPPREQPQLFTKGDGSVYERLHGVYTYGTKHSSGLYKAPTHAEMPTTVWLTNDGLECLSGAELSFAELAEVIQANDKLFYSLQAAVRSRHHTANTSTTDPASTSTV